MQEKNGGILRTSHFDLGSTFCPEFGDQTEGRLKVPPPPPRGEGLAVQSACLGPSIRGRGRATTAHLFDESGELEVLDEVKEVVVVEALRDPHGDVLQVGWVVLSGDDGLELPDLAVGKLVGHRAPPAQVI